MYTKIAEVLKREIRTTEDGSSTIYVPELKENYHSTHGAVQESMHVFIDAGLKKVHSVQPIKILEMGFGTGLNCLLTYLNMPETQIEYYAVEKHPVDEAMVKQLNFSENLGLNKQQTGFFKWIHTSEWDISTRHTKDKFLLRKSKVDFLQIEPKQKFHLIYFDAFAPEVQPKLWTLEVFSKMYDLLEHCGVLTTYCAKGQVRRNMIEAGFKVERLPGPPGKRQILRAIKD